MPAKKKSSQTGKSKNAVNQGKQPVTVKMNDESASANKPKATKPKRSTKQKQVKRPVAPPPPPLKKHYQCLRFKRKKKTYTL